MALIFDIKRFAINDGPGIRTTIFMKGCPLRCRWCHNPEGLRSEAQQLFTRKKCIKCGTCIGLSPEDAANECPTCARQISGKEWPMDELMGVIEKERKVMEDSKGGVTVSGGEPMMHPEYLMELLIELGKRGFHRCVDTTLFTDSHWVETVGKECELFLVDLKMMTSERHKQYTGVANEQILKNIRLVADMGHPYWIRIPMIEGVNTDDENINASAEFLSSLKTKPEHINLLPYHNIGLGKMEKIEKASLSTVNGQETTAKRQGLCGEATTEWFKEFAAPTEERQQEILNIFSEYNLKAIIGG